MVICSILVRLCTSLIASVITGTSYLTDTWWWMWFHFLIGRVSGMLVTQYRLFLLSSMFLPCRKCSRMVRMVLKSRKRQMVAIQLMGKRRRNPNSKGKFFLNKYMMNTCIPRRQSQCRRRRWPRRRLLCPYWWLLHSLGLQVFIASLRLSFFCYFFMHSYGWLQLKLNIFNVMIICWRSFYDVLYNTCFSIYVVDNCLSVSERFWKCPDLVSWPKSFVFNFLKFI